MRATGTCYSLVLTVLTVIVFHSTIVLHVAESKRSKLDVQYLSTLGVTPAGFQQLLVSQIHMALSAPLAYRRRENSLRRLADTTKLIKSSCIRILQLNSI